MAVHEVVESAARGILPEWACASPARRAHMGRVADLLGGWAPALAPDDDPRRWRAAGWLHDALRDADPEALRERVPPALTGLPGQVLHGPAVAEALRAGGVADAPLLRAVTWHTLGHPEMGTLGRSLYAADFLEPGRDFRNEWRADLRSRMLEEPGAVLHEIVAARIAHQVGRGGPLRSETVAFWNGLLEGG